MSHLRGRNSIHKINGNDFERRNSKKGIDQNLINYLTQVNGKSKFKKISSLNQSKDKSTLSNHYNYNGLNDNIHFDFERKNKARRSLLYLLNKMSGGTFCPQIVNYFKEIRELKKQEEQLKEVKEVKEEENQNEPIINQTKKYRTKNNKNLLSNLKNPILVGQSKNNYPNYKFNRRSGKDNNINNEEKNTLSKQYTNDFGIKELEHFLDSEEIEKMNGNKFNFNKEAQAKKKFLEEYTIDEDDRYYRKKERKNEKKYKQKIEYDEEENIREDIENFKKTEFPKLKIPKLNRLNTISGRGTIKKNNFLDKEKSSHLNNYNFSEIKEEK